MQQCACAYRLCMQQIDTFCHEFFLITKMGNFTQKAGKQDEEEIAVFPA